MVLGGFLVLVYMSSISFYIIWFAENATVVRILCVSMLHGVLKNSWQ